jgi:hypothetical protein
MNPGVNLLKPVRIRFASALWILTESIQQGNRFRVPTILGEWLFYLQKDAKPMAVAITYLMLILPYMIMGKNVRKTNHLWPNMVGTLWDAT